MEAIAWAREHFLSAKLGDFRLQRRLAEMAACIRENPRGTLPQAVEAPMELKAAYRLLSNPKVTHAKILQPHITATRQRCRKAGEYLLIEDTTALSFTQRAGIRGMGPLTNETSQGFLAHTNLAVRVERWDKSHQPEVVLMGVFGQQCWARKAPQGTRAERKKAKQKAKRAGASSESERWGWALREVDAPPENVRWTLVADRECDIFEVVAQCAGQGTGWIIRAAQGRRTAQWMTDVFSAAEQGPVLGVFDLALRSRPGVAARKAQVEVCACAVELLPPRHLRKKYAPQPIHLVLAREIEPPEGAEPIHWVLLTSWPCKTFEQTRRVMGAYTCRWLIEEYHKVLKTGTHIEESQLSTADRIEALLAIHAVVAVDLLQLKLLANTYPDEPVKKDLVPPEALRLLEIRFGRPASGWTNASTMRAIARMGGYLGRKRDGPPGWLSIWRGWRKLMNMAEGYTLALQQQTYG